MWLCYLVLYLVMKLVLVRGSRLTTADTGDLCLSSEQIAGQQKQRPSSFPLASLSQPSSLGCAMCLLPSFILCCICSTSQNKGKVKPVHTGELSSPGKLEQDCKTLCIRYYIISTALMLYVSSISMRQTSIIDLIQNPSIYCFIFTHHMNRNCCPKHHRCHWLEKDQKVWLYLKIKNLSWPQLECKFICSAILKMNKNQ